MGMACCCGCSVVQSCPTLCDPMDCSTPGLSVPHHLLKFAQGHVHCIGDAILPSHPLMPSSPLPSIFPSIRDFSNESAVCLRGPKYINLSISPSNEYSGLVSLKIDFFELFAVHFPNHSLKASILWCSAFFIVQLPQPYIFTWKTIALTKWTFVGKVMSLFFNTLSRFVIVFLPRSKRLLVSWLQWPSVMILEPKKRKSITTSTFHLPLCCYFDSLL